MLNQMLLLMALTSTPTGADAPRPADLTTRRIFTLAWTDVLVPAAATVSSAEPTASSTPRTFTLTWQLAEGRSASTQSAEPAPASISATPVWMTLTFVPRAE